MRLLRGEDLETVSRTYKVARPFATATRQLAAVAGNLARRAWSRESAYPGLRELVRAVYAHYAITPSSSPTCRLSRRTATSDQEAILAAALVRRLQAVLF